MRISDWSSDVCSSDLYNSKKELGIVTMLRVPFSSRTFPRPLRCNDLILMSRHVRSIVMTAEIKIYNAAELGTPLGAYSHITREIGRASCRERVCQYV